MSSSRQMSESEMHACVRAYVYVYTDMCVFVGQCTHLFLHEFQFAFRLQEALLPVLVLVTSTVKTASQFLLQSAAAVGE